MFETELATDRANRSALLLASERYSAQLAPFVKGSSTRLEYVREDLTRILDEVCRETGADFEYVSSRLEEHLAAAVLTKDPAKREKLKVKDGWAKNEVPPPTGDIHHTTLEYTGEVDGAGYDEARAADASVDLGKDTQKGTKPSERKEGCFRCGKELHEKVASITPVCADCTKELTVTSNCDCGGECGGDCKCKKEGACSCGEGKKNKKKDDEEMDESYSSEEKESSITKTAEAFTYELGPAGIHMQSVAEAVNNGHPFTMTTEPVGDLPSMTLSFPGDSPMQLMRWLIAYRKAGIPVEGQTVQIETEDPAGLVPILDTAGRKGGGSRPMASVEKEADLYGNGYGLPQMPNQQVDLAQNSINPVNEQNLPYVCEICGRQGTQQEIMDHVNNDHSDVLQRQKQQINNNPSQAVASEKEAAPAEVEEQAVVDPLPQAPGDEFDDMVQDLADRAAAIQFSSLDDKDLNALADSLGLTKDDIQGQLQTVAVFGNYVGMNGELVESAPDVPPGYTEVQATIRATAHEALIPTNVVISKVADSMNMEQDLAYQMVKDKYGGVDLPDKYHASVEGTYHFYLPEQLAGNASQDVAAEQGDIGPTAYAPSGGQPPIQ